MAALRFSPGQRWTYRGPPGDEASTLVVGSVERRLFRVIIHISVVRDRDPCAHLPFTERALRRSVLELVEECASPPPLFEEGLALWRKERGGAFSLSVSEVLKSIAPRASALSGPADSSTIDALVKEMRAARTEESVETLYRELFRLEEWVFLARPDDPRFPVMWVFPEGLNPKPCVLAFTDPMKAARGARSLEIGAPGHQPGVILARVEEAVPWLEAVAKQDGAEWVCFNFVPGSGNFPLYIAEARLRLARRHAG